MDWFNQSRLFELAREGRRLTPVWAVIPLALAFAIIAQFGSIPILAALAIQYGFSKELLSMSDMPVTASGLWMALFLISAFFLMYVFVAAWVWFFERRPIKTIGYERAEAWLRYGRGFIAGLLMFAAAVGMLAAFGAVSVEGGDPSRQGTAATGGVALVLVGWIVQGGAEEVLTRGWILPVTGARYRPWIGLLLSVLFFTFLHGLNDNLNWLAILNLALFGLFAALYAMREGSLWGISALHSAWNWIQGNIFGFEVSGMSAGGGTILNLTGSGPDWLTGGGFGPEGGIAVTMVLTLGILAVLLWPSKAGDTAANAV